MASRPSCASMQAITKAVDLDDRKVLAVAPCPEDIMVSKLARFSEKDKQFVEGYSKRGHSIASLLSSASRRPNWRLNFRSKP